MGLETSTYVNGLNASNPASTDGLAQADDHLRLIKSTLTATFPNLDATVTADPRELNILDVAIVTTDEVNKLDGFTAKAIKLKFTDGVAISMQSQLNTKAPTESLTPTGTTIVSTMNACDFTVVDTGTGLDFKLGSVLASAN